VIATTVIAARTPGMTLRRLPLFSWSMLVASTVWLATLPVLLVNVVLAYVDYRNGQLQYGLPAAMNQSFQWAFWQPQVYAYAIPVLGVMSEIVPVAARVRQRTHDALLVAIALFGMLSFGAFAVNADIRTTSSTRRWAAILVPLLAAFGGGAIPSARAAARPAGR
jgi:heme/copper-type cytochrome/quinol oxidase subunit 1